MSYSIIRPFSLDYQLNMGKRGTITIREANMVSTQCQLPMGTCCIITIREENLVSAQCQLTIGVQVVQYSIEEYGISTMSTQYGCTRSKILAASAHFRSASTFTQPDSLKYSCR